MFELEMRSESELYLSGCCGVLAYTDDNITMDFGKFSVCIYGHNLSMLSYVNGEMYIDGGIERLEFEPRIEEK